MATVACPTLSDYTSENCLENIPGLGTDVYIGLRNELDQDSTTGTPMVDTDGVFQLQSF